MAIVHFEATPIGNDGIVGKPCKTARPEPLDIMKHRMSLWGQVENALREIQALVEEINFLIDLLSAIEAAAGPDQFDRVGYNSRSTATKEYQKKYALEALLEAGSILDRKLKEPPGVRRESSAPVVVWKKNELEGLKKRLMRSLELLQPYLGIALFHRSLRCTKDVSLPQQSQRLAIVRQRYSGNKTDISGNREACLSRIQEKSLAKCRQASLRTPFWLPRIGWDIKINFKQFTYQHPRSELHSLVQSGDVAGLLVMFSSREASPFDRDKRGQSLLHYAAANSQLAICKVLISLGLQGCIDEPLGNRLTPRQHSLRAPLLDCRNEVRALELMDVFRNFETDSTPEEDCCFLIHGYSVETNDMYLLTEFQKRAAPLYFTLSNPQKYQAIRVYSFTGYDSPHPDADVFRYLLREDRTLQPTDIEASLNGGVSLLHSAALAFGRACRSIQTAIMKSKVDEIRWRPFLAQLLKYSASVDVLNSVEQIRHEHSISIPDLISYEEWTGTPLLYLLKGCYVDEYNGGSEGISNIQGLFKEHKLVVQRALQIWLEVLASCGVNLTQYGQREEAFFASNVSDLQFALRYSRWRLKEQDFLKKTLLVQFCGLKSGSKPEEWHIDWLVDI